MQLHNKDKNEVNTDIQSIAEQWVNLIFTHLDYKKRNKKENKNGETKI